jgi:hypothetical protein
MEKWVIIIIVVLLVPVLLLGGILIFAVAYPGGMTSGTGDGRTVSTTQSTSQLVPDPLRLSTNYTVVDGHTYRVDDYIYEGSTYYYNFTVVLEEDCLLKSIVFRLNWTDEPDKEMGPTTLKNNPDEFTLRAEWMHYETAPDNQDIIATTHAENNPGQEGEGRIEIDISHTLLEVSRGEGDWCFSLNIICGDYGKQDKYVKPPYEDEGNDFTLMIETEVYVPRE